MAAHGGDDPAKFIASLHQAPYKCVLALTGGGTGAVSQLLTVPGGSRTILEVVVPYGEEALCEWLGRRPDQFCSAETSRIMAERAYDRARWLAPGVPVVGVGCTASLATDRPKKGDHRFHVSWHSGSQSRTCSLMLTKGARDRAGEEKLLDEVLLGALAEAFDVDDSLPLSTLPGEFVDIEEMIVTGTWGEFFEGPRAYLWIDRDGRCGADKRPAALLSGSFNPVHEGHWRLVRTAERFLKLPITFELSVDNADKPSLGEEEVRRRLKDFAWHADVVLTRAPLFVQKAELFPGAVMIVGADTAERIVQSRFYRDESDMIQSLETIRKRQCRFLVAGRLEQDKFMTLDDLDIPGRFRDLFSAIPAADFRVDLSSTQLRAKHGIE